MVQYVTAAEQQHRILIDSVHAHNFLGKGLEPSNQNYHSLFGAKDVVEVLRAHGFEIDEQKTGKIDQQALQDKDTLFINLVSDNLPAFLVEEIQAIKTFVNNGGNLLVITDHSNCYHHSWKLEPLFAELGVKLYNESALEIKPRITGSGPGWIIIDAFAPHPVTRHLKSISFHSGGTIDENGGVAFLSKNGWGDSWATAPFGENAFKDGNRGNYGNFIRDEGERSGPLSVVLARSIGKGKMVVVADQNALGNLWIRFGDNYKLLMNIYAWFSNAESLAHYESFNVKRGVPVLLLDDLYDSRFGNYDVDGFYHAYALLSKRHQVFIHDSIDREYQLIVISPGITRLTQEQIDAMHAHLASGKHILVLGKPTDDQLFYAVEKGLVLTGRHDGVNTKRSTYSSGATLGIFHNVNAYKNVHMPAPTQKPSAKIQKVGNRWLELVETYIRQ